MRLNIASAAAAQRLAFRLDRSLREAGVPKSMFECRTMCAQIFGYRDWSDLKSLSGRAKEGPFDESIGPMAIRDRRLHHVEVLTGMGIPAELARKIVHALRPTARTAPRNPPIELGRVGVIVDRNEPEDLDFDQLGLLPPENWISAFASCKPGLLFVVGPTGSGKSVVARGALKEVEKRHGTRHRAMVLDGVSRDAREVQTAWDYVRVGRLVIVALNHENNGMARELASSPIRGFLGSVQVRTRLKAGEKAIWSPVLYDGFVDPVEASKHEIQACWF